MNYLIYDIEIRKAILGKGEARQSGREYCAGWQDHANMGVSVVGAYDYATDRWRVFCAEQCAGYGLDATCEVNFGINKTGNGAHAPVAWQRGRFGEVVDYCINDIKLTKVLFDHVLAVKPIIDPKDGRSLSLSVPS